MFLHSVNGYRTFSNRGVRCRFVGWEKSRLSRYDIRAEGAIPPSITVIGRVLNIRLLDLQCFF